MEFPSSRILFSGGAFFTFSLIDVSLNLRFQFGVGRDGVVGGGCGGFNQNGHALLHILTSFAF